jgi:hypothetical protein
LINLSLPLFSGQQGAWPCTIGLLLIASLASITHWVFSGIHGGKIFWKPYFHPHLLWLQESLLTLNLDTF